MSQTPSLPHRRKALLQLVGGAGLLAGSAVPLRAFAQAAAGKGYELLSPAVPTSGDGKLEVLEFFSYACPHCNDFEPLLSAWHASLKQPDVKLTKVPVTFNRAQWANLARLYYTLEALGALDRSHVAAFQALHVKREAIYKDDVMQSWAAAQGIDRDRFMAAYKSFGVQASLQRAGQLAEAYKVSGVPMLAVDGRYLVTAEASGSFEGMLKTVDQLLASVRGGVRPA